MRIFNVMLSRELGGIQQAYVDYDKALCFQSEHDVINISSCNALINQQLLPNHTILNLGSWCFLSKLYFLILFLYYRPDIVICHGNRSVQLCSLAKLLKIKLVGVSHNYSYKYLLKCDAVIALTDDLKNNLCDKGYNLKKIFPFHNMIYFHKPYHMPQFFNTSSNEVTIKNGNWYKQKIVIGSFGRFVNKKGFNDLIEAISILKTRTMAEGFDITLLLGGDGEEKKNLAQQVIDLQLQKEVVFSGWVNDKDAFFQKIDLFCLPSHSEAFGIVLLEAAHHSKPIIATNIGGPREIIDHNQTGLLVEKNNPADLAEKIIYLIKNPSLTQQMSKNAYEHFKVKYGFEGSAKQLNTIMRNIYEL